MIFLFFRPPIGPLDQKLGIFEDGQLRWLNLDYSDLISFVYLVRMTEKHSGPTLGMWEVTLNGAEVSICPETRFSYYPHHYPRRLKNGLKAFYCHGNWLMNMQTPWDNCLTVFADGWSPTDHLWKPLALLARLFHHYLIFDFLALSILTLISFCQFLRRRLSENYLFFKIARMQKNTQTRVDDFDQLNMFKGILFLFSIFLKLNSDHFPFF